MSCGGVGASTGYMECDRGRWKQLVECAGTVSGEVVELSALSADELPDLIGFLAERHDLGFGYVSVHGPAKDWHGDLERLARSLDHELPSYVSAVVMHPDNLEDPAALRALGSRLILENMDALKTDARTVAELAPFFDVLPDAGFCFDIAHAQMIDPSMRLAHELLDAFGDRLREVHLSSILPDGTHVPLLGVDVEAYRPVLERCRNVPWILEAALPGP